MNFRKQNIFLFSIILTCLLFSCKDSRWGGQSPLKKVSTHNQPIQQQLKTTFDIGNGIYASNEFAGARLNGIVLSNDTIVALINPENTPINSSPWYSFKIWSNSEQTIQLRLSYLHGVKHRYYPKLSHDGIVWNNLDSANFSKGFVKPENNERELADNITIKLSIGTDTLWISAQELITSKHVLNWTEKMAAKPFVSFTEISNSTEGRPINMLKIGNSDDKKMIIVLARQHPPEVSGYLAMKSFVETICEENDIAIKFRKQYNTYVVPLVNPDGVDNGHWRHNSGGIDLNRDWEHFNQIETQLIRDFMQNKIQTSGGKFYFGIDFHSTWEDIYYTINPNLMGNMPGLVPKMIDSTSKEIQDYEANILPTEDDVNKISSLTYFFYEFGAESLVYESGDETPRHFIERKAEITAQKLIELMLE
ncbi:MAG: hypothetical protein HN704_07555 [Bacteroidetes bacterium]|jgi:hypothetical protein|nr:hypothetical protein [Bacteroidota bacterium]MBT6685299.1 hypothetical protein [Bacteroidota bacterium]MBT7141746.1 hypothetical protein [Bacteroidota bacterium]MBT7491444.1 hypothetical protein [Bacteroidota bacterium]